MSEIQAKTKSKDKQGEGMNPLPGIVVAVVVMVVMFFYFLFTLPMTILNEIIKFNTASVDKQASEPGEEEMLTSSGAFEKKMESQAERNYKAMTIPINNDLDDRFREIIDKAGDGFEVKKQSIEKVKGITKVEQLSEYYSDGQGVSSNREDDPNFVGPADPNKSIQNSLPLPDKSITNSVKSWMTYMPRMVQSNYQYSLWKDGRGYKLANGTLKDKNGDLLVPYKDEKTGLMKVGNDYVVAMGSFYFAEGNESVGKARYRIDFSNDKSITVLAGDLKADIHTDTKHQYTTSCNNVIEFHSWDRSPVPNLKALGLEHITGIYALDGVSGSFGGSMSAEFEISYNIDRKYLNTLLCAYSINETMFMQGEIEALEDNDDSQKGATTKESGAKKGWTAMVGDWFAKIGDAVSNTVSFAIAFVKITWHNINYDSNLTKFVKDIEDKNNGLFSVEYKDAETLIKPKDISNKVYEDVMGKDVVEFVHDTYGKDVSIKKIVDETAKSTNEGYYENKDMNRTYTFTMTISEKVNGLVPVYDGDFEKDFIIPLPKNSYTITSQFGHRINPVNCVPGFHSGIDMAAAANTPIYASAAGRVAEAGYSSSYGNTCVVDNGVYKGKRITTRYAHMIRAANVSVGQNVEKGQLIGFVGTTGNSTGNHLHFEVAENTKKVDPRKYINV